MPRITLGKGAVKIIEDAVDGLFAKLKKRVLGGWMQDKKVKLQINPDLTLPALFRTASIEERNKPDEDLLNSLMRTANGYLDAQNASTRTQAVKAVESWLREAEAQGVDTDVETVLQGELNDIMRKAKEGVRRIIDTEATAVRNTGTIDGVIKVNAAQGIEDPIVYFIVVRDDHLCDECRRLHLRADGKPRLWHLSDLGHGYHKKGQENPKLGGLHPHCRCSLATLLPGYGFDSKGYLEYISPDWNEYDWQQKNPSEHEK
jgi:uncharacterized protein YqgV (UPF0045/DUF77 family)